MIVSQMLARTQPRISPADIETLLEAADLVGIVNRHTPLKKRGRAHWGPYPFHSEKTPSFKVQGHRYHCFGCGADGDALDVLTKLEGLAFPEAVERLRDGVGPLTSEVRERLAQERAARKAAEEADQRRKIEAARTLWRTPPTGPMSGTLGENYFRIARAITLDPLPPSLRFHPELPYYIEGEDGEPVETGRYPAILAAVQAPDRSIVAVHRTYLRPDGLDKAPVEKPKKLLGSMYAGSEYVGGAVRLAAAGETLGAGEGLESCASVLQETGIPM
jgi:DNA primase